MHRERSESERTPLKHTAQYERGSRTALATVDYKESNARGGL